jgi:hypothetical protein
MLMSSWAISKDAKEKKGCAQHYRDDRGGVFIPDLPDRLLLLLGLVFGGGPHRPAIHPSYTHAFSHMRI